MNVGTGGISMAKTLTPDICVIGAGPGGLAVATGAAAHGLNVVLVDRTAPGGRTQVPHMALAAAANQAQMMRDTEKFGVSATAPDIDFKAVLAHAQKIAADMAPAFSRERLAALGVVFIEAEARFTGRRKLLAGDIGIRARRYVLATGSAPAIPAIPGLEEIGSLTPDTIFEIGRRPTHLIILGGDAAALELAQTFRRLGSQVTILSADAVLPQEDPEMAAVVSRRLCAEGVTLREHIRLTGVERRGKTGVKALLETEAGNMEVDGSHFVISVGRTPDVEGLDLRKARVTLREGVVDVSAMLRTTNRRVYAIGGAAGAHSVNAARHQAMLVLKALLFRMPAKDRSLVPRVIRTDPELAHVGLTEAQAAARHRRLTILRWPYAENDLARAKRRTEGHIKLVTARNGRLLGVSIAGVNAAEMIGTWQLALSNGLGLRAVASSIPPHPSMAEIGKHAAVSYYTRKAHGPLVRLWVRLLRLFG